MQIIKRISRFLALIVVYIMCAGWYLTVKGFVITEDNIIFSNPAQADDNAFSQKVTGDIGLSEERIRALGDETAPLTIYDFSSMSCAHCRDFHKFTLPKIERDFISQGKVRFVFVHFPIEAVSMRAAKLSYCLPKDKFYSFIDELYDHKDWLFSDDETKLYAHAKKFGMTDEDIENCNQDKKLTSDIILVRDNAIENLKISGTPSFVVAGADGQELILGARSYDDMKEYLENRLKGE